MDILALVLNRGSQISEHLLVEAHDFVTAHVILGLAALFWTHLETCFFSALGEVALPKGVMRT